MEHRRSDFAAVPPNQRRLPNLRLVALIVMACAAFIAILSLAEGYLAVRNLRFDGSLRDEFIVGFWWLVLTASILVGTIAFVVAKLSKKPAQRGFDVRFLYSNHSNERE
jgi:hypothetical protein